MRRGLPMLFAAAVRQRVCLAAVLVLGFLFASPAAALAVGDAGQREAALGMLRKAAERNSRTQTLSTDFVQKKTLAILSMPLVSEGYMCFSREADGPRLLWAYTSPAPSGFLWEKGGGALWQGGVSGRRAPSAREARLLEAVSRQILFWLSFEPESVLRAYAVEKADAAARELVLLPRRPAFFERVRLVFAPGMASVAELEFSGGDEATALSFSQTAVDAPLPPRCRP